MKLQHILILFSCLVTVGCEPASKTPTDTEPQNIANLEVLGTTTIRQNDDIVAMANSIPIYRSDVEHHWRQHNKEYTPTEILEQLIEFELLAQRAASLGLNEHPDVQAQVRQEVVREFLHTAMVENHGIKDIRDDDYEFWYQRAIQRFDHETGYFGRDAQFVCCFGSDLEACRKDEQTQLCFLGQEPIMDWVYQELIKRGPYATKEEFGRTVDVLTREVESPRPLAQLDINFWYEQGVPYKEQQGYTKLNDALVAEVVATKVGSITKPVRSNHGWHVTYVYEVLPAKHLTSKSPEVRAEIAENIYPLLQKRDYSVLMKKLEAKHPATKSPELLEKLD